TIESIARAGRASAAARRSGTGRGQGRCRRPYQTKHSNAWSVRAASMSYPLRRRFSSAFDLLFARPLDDVFAATASSGAAPLARPLQDSRPWNRTPIQEAAV